MTSRLEVILFTYNHEAFVEQALKSVLSQKTDFEISIRIHDDCSSDRTVEVVKRLMSKSNISWSLKQEPENRYSTGISFFHDFIAESQTEFAAILDGDDFWIDDRKLQDQIDLLDRFPNATLCHHPVLEFASGELSPIEWPPLEYRQKIISGSKLAVQNLISTSSVVLRMSAVPRQIASGFNHLRIGDYPVWSLTTAGHDIAFVDRTMSAYRIHDSNIWASLSPEERFDRELEARIFICNNVPEEARTQWRAEIVNSVNNYLGLGAALAEAQLKLEIQAAELFTARQETQRILASMSWRFTKPLRVVMRILRRFTGV